MNGLPFNYPSTMTDSLGFRHRVLSCGFCGAGSMDRVVLDSVPARVIEAWARRHEGCEEKARAKWPARKAM